jgi:DNA-binding response OmpR family regulator
MDTDCTCPMCGGRIKDIGIKVEPSMKAVLGKGNIAKLTTLEWEVFKTLWKAAGPIPTERLFNILYGDREDGGPLDRNSVALQVCKMRKKLHRVGLEVRSMRDIGYWIPRG